MKPIRRTQPLLFILILLVSGLACNSLNRANEARQTAQAVITGVQGLATDIGPMVSTAQAYATQNPGLVETARSFTTTQGPAMLATAQAFATQNPEAFATGQAMLTELPGIIATGLDATVVAGSTSPANPDIPVLPENQRASYMEYEKFVNYQANVSLAEMINYYKSEMPVYDWLLDPGNSNELEQSAYLIFTKGDRTAQVTLIQTDSSQPTLVTIIISP